MPKVYVVYLMNNAPGEGGIAHIFAVFDNRPAAEWYVAHELPNGEIEEFPLRHGGESE